MVNLIYRASHEKLLREMHISWRPYIWLHYLYYIEPYLSNHQAKII